MPSLSDVYNPSPAFFALKLPLPPELALPQFPTYNHNQDVGIKHALTDVERVTAICAPTGFGKTLVPAVVAAMTGKRVMVLTGTKALQTQYLDVLGSALGLVDVRGQIAYQCRLEPELLVPDGPCHHGTPCQYIPRGCT